MVFVIHWHESAMDLHVFPIPIPLPSPLPPPSPPSPSPLGLPSAPDAVIFFFNGGPKSIAESPVYKCSLRFFKNFTKKIWITVASLDRSRGHEEWNGNAIQELEKDHLASSCRLLKIPPPPTWVGEFQLGGCQDPPPFVLQMRKLRLKEAKRMIQGCMMC